MILLDTDHLTVLAFPDHTKLPALQRRMAAAAEEFGVTIVTVEEELRGWLAYIHRRQYAHDQIVGYERLANLMEFFRSCSIVRFQTRAADEFERLRKQKIRIGTMDLKIAALALAQNALLLSANLRDYRKVPGLRVENWLEPAV